MINSSKFNCLLFLIVFSLSARSETLVGMVPGVYVNKDKNKFYLSQLEIGENGLITAVNVVSEKNLPGGLTKLKDSKGHWLGVYPGLIDLHWRQKQNVLPLWGHAHGQFGNRHEWRDWSQYQKDVSGNMNPWSGDFFICFLTARLSARLNFKRWFLGLFTTKGGVSAKKSSLFLMSREDGFVESQVNSRGDFVMPQAKVSAPTDLIFPKEFTFVWDEVKPIKEKEGLSFSTALEKYLKRNCLNFHNQLIAKAADFDTEIIELISELDESSFEGFVKKKRKADSLRLPNLYKPTVLSFIKENIDSCDIRTLTRSLKDL